MWRCSEVKFYLLKGGHLCILFDLFCKEDFLLLYIYLFTYIVMDSCIFVLCFVYTLWSLGGGSVRLTSVSFWQIPILWFSGISLLSDITTCSKLILYFPHSSSRIRQISKETWYLVLENGIRKQDLGAGCACCYWGVMASIPSLWTELDNIHMYTNRPGFKFHLNFLLAVGFLVSYLFFLSVGNSICKMGIVILPFRIVVRIRSNYCNLMYLQIILI